MRSSRNLKTFGSHHLQPTNLGCRIMEFQKTNPKNKRCADCGDLGPTFICMDFGTIICKLCAGIHREMNHRVKGIMLSEWTEDELQYIFNHGNVVDEKIYYSQLPPTISRPSAGQVDQLRSWIQDKYIHKKWMMSPSSSHSPSDTHHTLSPPQISSDLLVCSESLEKMKPQEKVSHIKENSLVGESPQSQNKKVEDHHHQETLQDPNAFECQASCIRFFDFPELPSDLLHGSLPTLSNSIPSQPEAKELTKDTPQQILKQLNENQPPQNVVHDSLYSASSNPPLNELLVGSTSIQSPYQLSSFSTPVEKPSLIDFPQTSFQDSSSHLPLSHQATYQEKKNTLLSLLDKLDTSDTLPSFDSQLSLKMNDSVLKYQNNDSKPPRYQDEAMLSSTQVPFTQGDKNGTGDMLCFLNSI